MLFIDDPLYENRENPIYYQDGIFRFQKVFQYISGQCFGDVALTSDKPRTASLIVLSDLLHCISINRAQYKIICEKAIQEQKKAMSLYSKIFPGIQPFIIQKFVQYLRPIKFTSQSILWQVGDEPQNLLIIVSEEGSGTISKQSYSQQSIQHCSQESCSMHIIFICSQVKQQTEELQVKKNSQKNYLNESIIANVLIILLPIIWKQRNLEKLGRVFHKLLISQKTFKKRIINTYLQDTNKRCRVFKIVKNQSLIQHQINSLQYHLMSFQMFKQNTLINLKSQDLKRNQKAFQLKYKDKLQKDLLVPNSELQQNIQKTQEKLFYMNNRHLQQKSKQELSLSNEIKNFKLNLSKSQSKFNQYEENFENIISIQHQYQLTDGSSLSPSKILQFNQSPRRDSQKKYQNLLNIQPSIKPNTFNKNISLSLRHIKSLHSQCNIKKRIQTDQSDLSEQQHQLLFITSCRNKYEKSPKLFPKLLLIEDDNN